MQTEHLPRDEDTRFADSIDEIADLLEARRPVDIEEYVKRHPDIEVRLRQAFESLERMYDLRPEIVTEEAGADLGQLKTLGDFRILREIGRGGMGVVYEAQQLSLQRRVALKILPFVPLLDSPQLQRFRLEARAAAMLKHPHIVSVYSIGCERGVNYYAMELINGPSLADIARSVGEACQSFQESAASKDTEVAVKLSTHRSLDRSGSYREIARMGIQIADALKYAHGEGVIHRDVKPANLLLDDHGNVHLADFGLARTQTAADLTVSGDMLGTLRYMSPEQVDGDQVVDQRTDIYSLGLTLYELISGIPAFRQTSRRELIEAIETRDAESLIKHDERAPMDLVTIIEKASSKDAAHRYQSARDLAEDLQRFLDHRAIAARRASSRERLARVVKRNPLVTKLVAAVLVLLLGISTVSTVLAWRFASDAARQARLTEREARESRTRELGLYARDLRLARLALDRTETLYAEQLLLKWVPNSDQEDHRGIEWYHLWSRCHNDPDRWTIDHPVPVRQVAFSPDGTRLATSLFAGRVNVWDISDRRHRSPPHEFSSSVKSAWALKTIPHSDLLIVGGGNRVTLWNWSTNERTDLPAPKMQYVRDIRFVDMSPDGELISAVAYHPTNSTILMWNRSSQDWLRIAQLAGIGWSAFDAQGRLVFASSRGNNLGIADARTGKLLHEWPLTGTWRASAISPEGKSIAICVSNQRGDINENWLEYRRLDSWELTHRSLLGEVTPTCIRVYRTNDAELEIAVGNSAGQLLQIDVPSSGVVRHQLHDGPVRSVDFSPDGRTLASAGWSKHVCVLSREPMTDAAPAITRCGVKIESIAAGVGFIDEGRTVCTGEAGNRIHLWDAYTGRPRGEPIELDDGPWNLIGIQTDGYRQRMAIVQSCWPFDMTVDEQGRREAVVPGRITIWDYSTRRVSARFDFDDEVFIHSTPFSQDGRYLAICHLNTLSVINLETNEVHDVFQSDTWVHACDFSPGNRQLLCAMTDGKTRSFEIGTWRALGEEFVTDSQLTENIRFSPDGRLLGACGFDRRLKLFDSVTRRLIVESAPTPMYHVSLRFSPCGKRVAMSSLDGKVRVFMTETADEVLSIDVPNTYPFCEFTEDGSSLAIAAGDVAMVIHAPNRKSLQELSATQLRDFTARNSTEFRK